MTNTDTVTGLRALADFFEQYPDLAEHINGQPDLLGYVGFVEDPVAVMAAFARAGKALGVPVEKDYDDNFGKVRLHFGPVALQAYAERGQVCERVVVSTETVVEEVPDPEALAKVPTVQVAREVEQVEWRCHPLLAQDREPVSV